MNLNELPVIRRLSTESFLTEGLPHIAVDREDFEAFKEALESAVGSLEAIESVLSCDASDIQSFASDTLTEIKKILGGV